MASRCSARLVSHLTLVVSTGRPAEQQHAWCHAHSSPLHMHHASQGCDVQGGFVSVWHDANASLNYALHAFHRLMPHFRSEALGLQASLVALVPTMPRFPLEGSPSDTPLLTPPHLMWASAVMSNGQIWRWRVPLPLPQTSAYSAPLPMRHSMPAALCTFTSVDHNHQGLHPRASEGAGRVCC